MTVRNVKKNLADSSPNTSWSELVVSTNSLLVREALRRSTVGLTLYYTSSKQHRWTPV